MLLPSNADTVEIDAICAYLASRTAGAAVSEIRGIPGKKDARGRTLAACRQLGLIDRDSRGRILVTARGRGVASDRGRRKSRSYIEAIFDVPAYKAIMERVTSEGWSGIAAPGVAAFWYTYFRSAVSKTEASRISQAVCFFRLLAGAGLGVIVAGRPGRKTQFAFDPKASRNLVLDGDSLRESERGKPTVETGVRNAEDSRNDRMRAEGESRGEPQATATPLEAALREEDIEVPQRDVAGAERVFISCGGNHRILDQVRELVALGKFEAVAATYGESIENALEAMRSCKTAVIHAASERTLRDEDSREVRRTKVRRTNQNALLELGAALAIHGRNIVLLAEGGDELPVALKELRACRYSGDALDGAAIMALIKALRDFASK